MPSSPRHRPFCPLLAVVLAALLYPVPGATQQPEDPLVRRGTVRLELTPTHFWWSRRFGERSEGGQVINEKEPLGFDLTRDRVGAAMIPSLAPFEDRIAELLQDQDFEMDLGSTDASWSYSQTRFPIRLDVGVTDWLTVSGMVPLVRTETLVDVSVRGDSVTANSGYGPIRDQPAEVNQFLTALTADVTAFEAKAAQICADLGAGSQECADAEGLLAEGQGLDASLSGLYLDPNAFFPLTGTDAGRGVEGRVDAFRSGLESYGQVAGFGAAPLSGTGLDGDGFNRILTESAYGVSVAPLVPLVGGWGMGDAELSVAARLLSNVPPATDPGPTLQYQVGAEATLRLATGTLADPDTLQTLDVGGVGGVRLRMFGSVQAGPRWGLRGHLAADLPQSVNVVRRVSAPDVVLAPSASRAQVSWQPGSTLDLYVAPRLTLARGLALTVPYRFLSKGEDEYTTRVPSDDQGNPLPVSDASVLGQETSMSLHRVGVGVIFSTLPAFREDRSSFPMELRAQWHTSVAGGGGRTPELHGITFSMRLFLSFWGDGA